MTTGLQRVKPMPLFGEERREYQVKRRAKWRVRVTAYLGGKCAGCGATVDLHIHHRDRSKKLYFLSRIWTHKWEKQKAELDKCELRCQSCHKKLHAAEHGGLRKYNLGCRCDRCVANHREQDRINRAAYRASGRDKSRNNYVH